MSEKIRWVVKMDPGKIGMNCCLGEDSHLVPLGKGGFCMTEEDALKEAEKRIDAICFHLIPDRESNKPIHRLHNSKH